MIRLSSQFNLERVLGTHRHHKCEASRRLKTPWALGPSITLSCLNSLRLHRASHHKQWLQTHRLKPSYKASSNRPRSMVTHNRTKLQQQVYTNTSCSNKISSKTRALMPAITDPPLVSCQVAPQVRAVEPRHATKPPCSKSQRNKIANLTQSQERVRVWQNSLVPRRQLHLSNRRDSSHSPSLP